MRALKVIRKCLVGLSLSAKVWIGLVVSKVVYEAVRALLMYQRWDAHGLFRHDSRASFVHDEVERILIGGALHALVGWGVVLFARTERLAIQTAFAVAGVTVGVDWLFSDSRGAQDGVAMFMFYFGLLTLVGIFFFVRNRSEPPA
jgi:hypothetical protein